MLHSQAPFIGLPERQQISVRRCEETSIQNEVITKCILVELLSKFEIQLTNAFKLLENTWQICKEHKLILNHFYLVYFIFNTFRIISPFHLYLTFKIDMIHILNNSVRTIFMFSNFTQVADKFLIVSTIEVLFHVWQFIYF